MSIYKTFFPVYTPDGTELVPANTIIDEPLLQTLKQKPANRTLVSLDTNGTFKKDVGTILEKEIYATIFREKESRDTIYEILKKLSVPLCEFEVFEFFKEKEFATYEHLLSVFMLSSFINSRLRVTNKPDNLLYASLSHDIGKSSIPLDIIHKEAPLTTLERNHIEHHPIAGYCLLHYFYGNGNTEYPLIARDHHENKSGTGYPVGNTNITLNTEVVIACDIYDALLSPRAYRNEAFDNRTALEELTRIAIEGQISEDIVRAFVAANRTKKTEWYECTFSTEVRGVQPKDNNYGKTQEG